MFFIWQEKNLKELFLVIDPLIETASFIISSFYLIRLGLDLQLVRAVDAHGGSQNKYDDIKSIMGGGLRQLFNNTRNALFCKETAQTSRNRYTGTTHCVDLRVNTAISMRTQARAVALTNVAS